MDRHYECRNKKISYDWCFSTFSTFGSNIMFWQLFSGMGMTTLSIIGTTFHCLFICIETVAGISRTNTKMNPNKTTFIQTVENEK